MDKKFDLQHLIIIKLRQDKILINTENFIIQKGLILQRVLFYCKFRNSRHFPCQLTILKDP